MVGVLIAFFIAVVGIVSVLSLFTISLRGLDTAQQKLIASHLAQEGIETVRYIRRANEDDSSRWTNWYSSLPAGPDDYRVQYDLESFLSYLDTPLLIDGDGFYQYNSGVPSKFYRKVTLEKISAIELKVVVDIKWQNQGGEWSHLIAEDRLWDWR